MCGSSRRASRPVFAEDDGELDPQYSDDRVHVNEAGYTAWADAVRPHLSA